MERGFYFNDCYGSRFSLEETVDEVLAFMRSAPERKYKVIIGSDSEQDQAGTDFVSALVVHRVGNGGRYWWRRVRGPSFGALRDRIYEEALMSLKIAQELILVLRKDKILNLDLEIHVDVGTNGETRTMLQEVVGMIRGSGFEVKTKPESYGASKVADRHV